MASSYSNIHPVNEILKGIVGEAIQSDSALIADKVFEQATIKVPAASGTFLKENARNYLGLGAGLNTRRAPGASRTRANGFDRSNIEFKCEIHSLEYSIAMEDIEDSQYDADEEARAARMILRTMKLDREKRAADLLFDSTQFETGSCTAVVGGKFDAAGTKAFEGLRKLRDTVMKNAHGLYPDTLILGHDVFEELIVNPDMRRFLGDVTAGFASGDLLLNDDELMNRLRNKLKIQNIFVGSARRDTAVAGATSSEGFIWNNETVFMGCLRPEVQPIVNTKNVVRGLPVAALNFEYKGYETGVYDSPDFISRNVYIGERMIYKAIDSKLGFVMTDCLT